MKYHSLHKISRITITLNSLIILVIGKLNEQKIKNVKSWWRHQMETFPVLLAICAGNSPVFGEFPTQRPVTRSFDDFLDLRLNKRLSKQWWGWWFETLSHPLWRHRNGMGYTRMQSCLTTVSPGSFIIVILENLNENKIENNYWISWVT